MKVEQLPPERVGELAAVYNDHVADVPLSEAVSVERFAEIWAWRSDRSAQLETEQAIYADALQRLGFSIQAISMPFEGQADLIRWGENYLFTYGRLRHPGWSWHWGWPPWQRRYGSR